jgi:peptide/nickel transport system substrate-binding protein
MRVYFRWSLLVLLIGLLIAPQVLQPIVSSAASSAPQPENTALQSQNVLVEAVVGEIRKLNPLLATYNPVDRDITSLIFEGLTTTNDYGEIVPQLAESWTVTQDGLQYIVVLRGDVLWHDGIPFSAADVVFTTNLLSDPNFPGAESLYEFWRTVEVDQLDARTIRFRLTQPLASFTDQLRIGIVPAHVLQGVPVTDLATHPFNLAPIGTGPYQLETLTASGGLIDGVQLRVAPVYRQRPEGQTGYMLDRVIFRTYPTAAAALDAFRQGQVNSIGMIPTELQADARTIPGLSLYTGIEPHVGVLIYNWERDSVRFVRNARARVALAHAVDRTALVTQHLADRAIPADSPLLPTSWAYTPDTHWPDYDLARAQAILDTANLTFEAPAEPPPPAAEETAENTDGTDAENATEEPDTVPVADAPTTLSLTILVLDDPALVALAGDIAENWQQLGFASGVVPVDAETLHARLEAGNFDAAIVEYSFAPYADPDPYVFWHQGQYQLGQNFGGMDDRRISEALENARRDPYGVNRVVHYTRFQQLFAERAPALTLYYPLYIYGADTRLEGVQLGFLSTPSDRFRHIQTWAFQ